MRWRRKDLDAVLYAIFKTMDEVKPDTERYRILRAQLDRLGMAAHAEQDFVIEVHCAAEDENYQRVVNQVRAARIRQWRQHARDSDAGAGADGGAGQQLRATAAPSRE